MGIDFKNPEFLFLLLPFAGAVFWYVYSRLYLKGAAIAVPSEAIVSGQRSFRVKTYRYLPVLRFLSVFVLILALARPGKGVNYASVKNLGIDIMVALDVSGSMKGEDFQPKNRLMVAKQVLKDFVAKRKSDRIGLVVFSGEAHFQCPLTIEHQMITDIVDEIDFDTVPEDGTAIGEALALAASRMLDSGARSKIILLLTDGMNNRGSIDPETAAKLCAESGIRVYAVGIGKDGKVRYPSDAGFLFGRQYLYNHFDETGIRKIADATSGKFYRATSGGVLWEKISDIDRLERSEFETRQYYEFYDRFQILLAIAMGLFFLEVLLRSVLYRKVP
ncbi:MAG TPA: VWA domain-containing protein [Spirochaetota bacterium]|nr:VWA domain-containing protein [Spirochaetota bacterium]